MTHTVVVTVATAPEAFPANTVASGVQVTLESFAPVLCTAAPYVATFTGVAAGATYSIVAQTLDNAGNPLGAAFTGSVTLAPDAPTTVNIDIPTGVTTTVQ